MQIATQAWAPGSLLMVGHCSCGLNCRSPDIVLVLCRAVKACSARAVSVRSSSSRTAFTLGSKAKLAILLKCNAQPD